jgi:hypothetical protein
MCAMFNLEYLFMILLNYMQFSCFIIYWSFQNENQDIHEIVPKIFVIFFFHLQNNVLCIQFQLEIKNVVI